jgi:hypothetical protein
MENSGNDSAAPAHSRTAAGRLRDYAKQLMNVVKPPDNGNGPSVKLKAKGKRK